METIKAAVLVADPHAEGVQAAAIKQAVETAAQTATDAGYILTGEYEVDLYEDAEGKVFGVDGLTFAYVVTVAVVPHSRQQVQQWMNK